MVDKNILEPNICIKRLMSPATKKASTSKKHLFARIDMIDRLLFSKGV